MSCLAHYQCLTMYFSNVSTYTIVLSLLQLLLAEPPVDELAGDAHFLRDVGEVVLAIEGASSQFVFLRKSFRGPLRYAGFRGSVLFLSQ